MKNDVLIRLVLAQLVIGFILLCVALWLIADDVDRLSRITGPRVLNLDAFRAARQKKTPASEPAGVEDPSPIGA